jgi:hypothetical protein
MTSFRISTIILLLSLTSTSLAQKMKKIQLCDGPYNLYAISANLTLNESNTPTDTSYLVLAKNFKYTEITEFIVVKKGSFNDVWNFFTYCLEFLQKEDIGVSENHNGNYISVSKQHGFKMISVFGEGKDSSGFVNYNQKYLDKILSCLEEWDVKRRK